MDFQFSPSLYAPTFEQALLTRLRWDSWRASAEDPLFGLCPVLERFARKIDAQTDRSSVFRPKGDAGRRYRRRFIDAVARLPYTWAPEREHDRARRIVELAQDTLGYDLPYQTIGRYIQRNGWGGERGRERAIAHEMTGRWQEYLDWGFLILAYEPAADVALGRDPRRTLDLFEQLIAEHHAQEPSRWFTPERAESDRLFFPPDLWTDLLSPDDVRRAAALHPEGQTADAVIKLARLVSPRATMLEHQQWSRYLASRDRWQRGERAEPQAFRFGLTPVIEAQLLAIEARLVAARAGLPLPAARLSFGPLPEMPATAPLVAAARAVPRQRLAAEERRTLAWLREDLANYARFEGFPHHRPASAAQWLDELIGREQSLIERPRSRSVFEARYRRIVPLLGELATILPENATATQLLVMLDACTPAVVRVESERRLRRREVAAVFPRLSAA